MRVGFEHSALYLTKEQAELGIIANSVWLNLGEYSEDGEELSGRYVQVVGIFDPGDKGHLRGWTASTGDISSLIPLTIPRQSRGDSECEPLKAAERGRYAAPCAP
jgi:hypothetical protein